MPRVKIVKTRLALSLLGLLLCIVVGGLLYDSQRGCGEWPNPDTELTIKGATYSTVIADTDTERVKGLSGTKCLDNQSAMLFSYSEITRPGFWMKDMNYSIDIVWLDSDKRVVHLERSLTPESYPTVYYPSEDSQYVIEFAVGSIDRTGISTGDSAIW